MGYIATLLSKDGGDVSGLMLRMLNSIGFKGDGLGLASHEGSAVLPWQPEEPLRGDSMIGCRYLKITPPDSPQPLSQYGYHFAVEGRLWSEGCDALETAERLGRDPDRGLRALIKGGDGSYVVAILHQDRILCGRDPIGLVPLYIGESGSLVGAASNRKMLWSVGLEAEPLKPGFIAKLDRLGMHLEEVRTLEEPGVRAMEMEEAVELLDEAMRRSVERRVRGLSRVCLAFSGGLDSSILARFLDLSGVDVELLCVGLKGSRDFEAAEEAAEHIGLPLRLESYGVEELEKAVEAVLWSVEEADPLKISIALPLHWCAKASVEEGVRVLFSGVGSDELFGGYKRYVDLYPSLGEGVRAELFRDVVDSYEVNYARDYKVCSDLGVELRAPYTDLGVVELGLSLPIDLKLSMRGDRKLVLRRLAEALGLPEEVVWRRKRAIQYSTGVSKALRRLAKRRHLSLRGYLEEALRRLREG
jgi:asparagine synthase (glutamine-hydrolysing)